MLHRTHSRRTLLLALPVAAMAAYWGLTGDEPNASPAILQRAAGDRVEPASRNDAGRQTDLRQPTAARSARGWYGAPVGTRLRFDLAADQGIELASGERADATQGGGKARLRAELVLTIVDRTADAIHAAVQFDALSLEAPQAPDGEAAVAAIRAQLGRATWARFAPTGRITGFHFPVDFDFHARNEVRSLLQAFRFVLDEDAAAASWRTEERDETGELEVEYHRRGPSSGDLEVERRKLGYLALAGAGNSPEACAVAVEGRAEARFDSEAGWLAEAEVHERTSFDPDGAAFGATVTFDGSLKLRSVTRLPQAELPAFDPDADWEAAASAGEAALAVFEAHEAERWRAELEGIRLGDLVGYLDGLVQSGQITGEEYDRTWEEISRLCELDPEAVSELTALIESGRYDDVFASSLLTALGNAETAEAQTALTAIHASERHSVELRAAATVALVQARRPSPAALDALWNTAFTARAPELGGTSLLVFGALAGRATGEREGPSALDRLLEAEAECAERGTLDTWLHALGNSGASRALERALAYLEHADAGLRAAAAAALRGRSVAGALRGLLDRLVADPDATVRMRVIESLAETRDPAAWSPVRAALAQSALRDDVAVVREAALLALASRPDVESTEILRRVAQGDVDEHVRETARRLLAGS